jgi:hypothetical protein
MEDEEDRDQRIPSKLGSGLFESWITDISALVGQDETTGDVIV